MTPQKSDVVIALRGRDAEKRFFVVGFREELALIADGKSRRLEKPKAKKLKHLSPTGEDAGRVQEKLRVGEKVTNGEIRRALAALSRGEENSGGMRNG
ncbi:MAG: KOW domain-containing RNA-binding protein [bacterium]